MDVADATFRAAATLTRCSLRGEYFRRRVLRFLVRGVEMAALLVVCAGLVLVGAGEGGAPRRVDVFRPAAVGALLCPPTCWPVAAAASRFSDRCHVTAGSVTSRAGLRGPADRRAGVAQSGASFHVSAGWDGGPDRTARVPAWRALRVAADRRTATTDAGRDQRHAIVPIAPKRVITIATVSCRAEYLLSSRSAVAVRISTPARTAGGIFEIARGIASASASARGPKFESCPCAQGGRRGSRALRGQSHRPRVEISPLSAYPFWRIASHVIGYIGRIPIATSAHRRVTRGELPGLRLNRKVGVELSYERDWHGTTAWGSKSTQRGRQWNDVAHAADAATISSCRSTSAAQVAEKAFGDRRGALGPSIRRGQVMALCRPATTPTCRRGIDPANCKLNESPDKPLLNRPLRGAYPPGSTIKPFLALGALTSGKRTPTQAISDPGYYQLPGQAHRFRDDKPGGHGMVDMYKSIVVSCDTYYYTLAGETDIDDTWRFMSQLGFGAKTGLDIEGELTGILPSREWKRTRFAGPRFRDEHRKWYLGDSISAGIGQGIHSSRRSSARTRSRRRQSGVIFGHTCEEQYYVDTAK